MFFDIFTVVVATFLLIRHWHQFIWGSSRYVIFLLFFIFYVFPLYLDLMVGIPSYGDNGFRVSSRDQLTRGIYDLSLIFSMFIILYYKRKKEEDSTQLSKTTPFKINTYVYIGMVMPAILTIFVLKEIALLYTFQWRELEIFEMMNFYSYVEHLTYIGITCSIFLLFRTDKGLLSPSRFIGLIFLYINICVQGKRAILFFAVINIVILLYILYRQKKQNHEKTLGLALGSIVVVALLVGYMFVLNLTVKIGRGYNESDAESIISSTRVDFLRDDRVKLALFSETHSDNWPMLDYPCQTILYDVMSIFPTNLIFIKLGIPYYTYQHYLTKCLDHTKFDKDNHYMTPCVFAELVSNFGIIIGILLMPLLCVWFAKKADKYSYPVNITVICSFVLINMFSIEYVMFYLEFATILCLVTNRKASIKCKKSLLSLKETHKRLEVR